MLTELKPPLIYRADVRIDFTREEYLLLSEIVAGWEKHFHTEFAKQTYKSLLDKVGKAEP